MWHNKNRRISLRNAMSAMASTSRYIIIIKVAAHARLVQIVRSCFICSCSSTSIYFKVATAMCRCSRVCCLLPVPVPTSSPVPAVDCVLWCMRLSQLLERVCASGALHTDRHPHLQEDWAGHISTRCRAMAKRHIKGTLTAGRWRPVRQRAACVGCCCATLLAWETSR